MQLNFKVSFSNLYTRSGLIKLDEAFLDYIKSCDESLFCLLIEAREKAASSLMSSQCLTLGSRKQEERIPVSATWMTDSQLIIDLSYLLDEFIAKLFNIEKEIEELKKKHNDFAVIYKCKRLFVQRYALKKYTNVANIDITNKLSHFLTLPTTEKNFAKQVMHWFEDKENHKEEIELAAQYAAWRVKNKQSILFSIHRKIDHENLIPFSKKEVDKVEVLYSNEVKRRYGFDLTSKKVSLNKALDNAHYCIFCHKQNKDSCSKGLINNDNTFKQSPLKVELHGCPLEQKISEMNLMKSEGYSIASLAIVMIDNPLCAATGHRICNDCMNSCIYQKQEPVNVPMIETRILDDVLSLPYGFEIYSLLSRWNPLNFQRSLPRENTGKNVLVAGLGPAGFNLAHHLLNDGHNVIAIDGLKIEPLIDNFQLIKDFKHEKLSERTADGFGGVAEYGITSRWDKNYLKIIRLLLERRENFALYGGIRFGGTINVDDAFNLGFDHIALALGSGKPRMIKIKNILARGVRMASDFLMSLQLTGALKFDSIANLQVRMPIVVIGAGLTAIDTATEALAYYPIQVEKFLLRYEILVDKYGKDCVEKDWTEEEREIANEFISHAQLIQAEQELAKKESREIKILELMQSLGGVKVVYRKELKDSPSYRLNSEEVQNALSEGIYFIENLEPVEVVTNKYNHAESIKLIDTKSGEIKRIKARSIFIAAGTEPNTVIATEDKKHFKLSNGYFTHLNLSGKEIDPIFSPKMQNKDRILVYKQGNKTISFFGDLHPSYSGSVVKAMASAKNGYPIISQLLNNGQPASYAATNEEFFNKIKEQFTAKVIKVQYLTDKVVEIVIKAPLAAKNFKPGQFYRLQNFATYSRKTNLAMEGIAVTGTEVDKKKRIISTIVLETGGSTNLCRHLREGEQIILMGPTGCPTEVG
ncbi:putative bifunctional glutamate synthase subunit beta/2-polyprenylphenol hydroxylase [Wolbachia endosymbiont of Armadillidium vulgare str. wVulC]|uniref:FAD-dependent oxidoreductase n=1 Tax=Wolbachia endosymbiont of Armadillidium vulgare TaxID=77039 RepID=UPI000649CADB|nr:FAD-dependent oxidoreductase [Wolbachia endosymbiont of Armadillidium vulgare]KLT22205.1 putative bifunctional glutamate synthase subunit beta/2-polyprenylphenol hydroxylase [Wolbachia endosymbiont of Armadillidium vulgare str. wVulC]OJH31567.1 Glutamate synthase [NADPH] small chain [Wolbachia endosymbiont of Armadillidium vulgare]OJH32211.1 Glutamate synthase [NADPH] small chain [Wolbachia endosymbiont of Armadillidium vulgare]OJH32992.1 Glutamate synthase [NADPH] small chain [Wolbachia end